MIFSAWILGNLVMSLGGRVLLILLLRLISLTFPPVSGRMEFHVRGSCSCCVSSRVPLGPIRHMLLDEDMIKRIPLSGAQIIRCSGIFILVLSPAHEYHLHLLMVFIGKNDK